MKKLKIIRTKTFARLMFERYVHFKDLFELYKLNPRTFESKIIADLWTVVEDMATREIQEQSKFKIIDK